VSHPTQIFPPLSRVAARSARLAVSFALFGALLFAAAGRLDWWEVWVFLAGYYGVAFLSQLWIMRRDPALDQERRRLGQNVKPWDTILVNLHWLLTLLLLVVIGLDAGRFRWSVIAPGWRVAGGLGLLLSFGFTLWAARANTFLSGQVRIQTERGHHTITGGPYRFVRHPMYLSMIVYDVSLPLLLGSGWALCVSGLMIGLMLVRTALEDRTLHAELPGYTAYARQTPYRLFPGLW
jgi:protein-S-isoprenylcysteine O-methyltransferase Ste14